MLSIGQVVFSKSGRDKGRPFLIHSIEGEFVFLIDGELRPIGKPKKKKMKHIQFTNDVFFDIKDKLDVNAYLTDADIKKTLKPYINNSSVSREA